MSVAVIFLRSSRLDRGPLLVRRGVAAGDDVCEVLRGAGAVFEVEHVVVDGVPQSGAYAVPCSTLSGDWRLWGELSPVVFGVGGVAAEVSDALEVSRVFPIIGIGPYSLDSVSFRNGGLVDVFPGNVVLIDGLDPTAG